MKKSANPQLVHKDHEVKIIEKPQGSHAAKLVCASCNGKFIQWLPKNYRNILNEKN